MAERTAREMAIQRAAQALKGKDATMIYQSPAMLEREKRSLERYNLNPDDFSGLQPHLGRVRQQKADELRSEEKIQRDLGRLASQGVRMTPEELRRAASEAASAQVRTTDLLPFGTRGAYDHDTGNIHISTAVQNPRAKDRLPSGELGSWQGERTLRHEIEHAYDEAAGLAQAQAPLLDRLGAHRSEHHDHDHGQSERDRHLAEDKLYDRGHMRIGVMHMRDDTGKQFLDGKDLQNILGLDKQRKSRMYLERMMQSNPGMSLDKLAQLINQVAVRERAVAGAQA
jgi:hypothetical protein